MIANVSAHRRANAFAQVLEERRAPQDRTAEPDSASAADGQRRLVALAGALGELPRPGLDPEVKVVQRAQMVAAMEAMFAGDAGPDAPLVPEQRARTGAHRARPARKSGARSRWSKGLAAGGLTVGVAAGAFSGVAAASSDALPGDSLYGLKLGMEDLKLGLTDSDADRGELYLDQASTRMNEARRLMERARSGGLDHESLREVRKALSGMQHDASEGHRLLSAAYARDGSLGPIRTLESFSKSNRDNWGRLRERLPVQLSDVSDQVSSVFDAIDDEIGPLMSLLPGTEGSPDSSRESAGSSDKSGTDGSSQQPTPSGTPSGQRTGESAPQPTESRQQDEQLIGGTGDLLDPQSSSGPTGSDEDGSTGSPTPEPEITLPPLLPGLLPGLGIDGEDST